MRLTATLRETLTLVLTGTPVLLTQPFPLIYPGYPCLAQHRLHKKKDGRNIERNGGRVNEARAAYQRNRLLIPIYTFISHHLNLMMCHDTFPAGSVTQAWIMSFLTELTCVLLSSPFFHYYVLFTSTAKKQGVAMINHFRRCHFTISPGIKFSK